MSGGRRRAAPRQSEADHLAAEWEAKKSEHWREVNHRLGRDSHLEGAEKPAPVESFDDYGVPKAKGDASSVDIDGEDVALGLERAYVATGDPIFSDALAALRAHGLAGGKPRKSHAEARRRAWGDHDLAYLRQMRWVCEHGESELSAAQNVAAKFFVDAPTFEVAVRRLRDRYSVWKKDGFPDEDTQAAGDIGYSVIVRARPGLTVINPVERRPLDPSGETVKWTSHWRRRFADGDIEIIRA